MISVMSVMESLNPIKNRIRPTDGSPDDPSARYRRLVLVWSDDPSSDRQVRWFATEDSGQVLAMGECDDEALPRADLVIVLIDSQRVTPLVLDLPPLSPKQQAQALQWAAEELIAGSIEEEHVVAGTRNASGQLQAIAVQHAFMAQHHSQFWRAGVDVVMPDALCLPHEPETVSLTQVGDRLLMRWGEWSFGSFDMATGLIMLEAQSAKSWVWWGDALPPKPIEDRVEVRSADQSPLAVLAAHANPYLMNLLSDPYLPASSQARQGQWRWVFGLSVAVMVLATAHLALERYMLANRAQALRSEVTETFTRLFPGQAAMGRERELAMREMARLQYGRSAGLLELLSQVIPIVAGSSAVTVAGLTYESGELVLNLTAPDVATLDQLALKLKAAELEASVESATLSIQGARADLLIQRGRS